MCGGHFLLEFFKSNLTSYSTWKLFELPHKPNLSILYLYYRPTPPRQDEHEYSKMLQVHESPKRPCLLIGMWSLFLQVLYELFFWEDDDLSNLQAGEKPTSRVHDLDNWTT